MRTRFRIARRCAGATIAVALAARPAGAQTDSVTYHLVRGAVGVITGAIDNIVVSNGADGLLLVDVGYPETLNDVRRVLTTLSDRAPALVINTHWHHTFANAAFGPSATIIAHASVRDRIRHRNFMYDRWVLPQPPAGWPTVTFQDSLTVHFNGERIEIRHLPCAHTDGDVAVFFTRSNVVATGDVFVPHVPWVDRPAGGDVRCLLAAVDTLLRLVPRDAIIVPGHDRLATYRDLEAYRDVLRSLASRVRTGIARGMSRQAILDAGLDPEWQSWERVIPARILLADFYDALAPSQAPSSRYELKGGRWFDGVTFVPATRYVVDGRFQDTRPSTVDSVIDLAGGFVVPPYGEAHTHQLGALASVDETLATLTAEGVFYAMVQDPIDEITPEHRARFERPATTDVVYTQAVITPSWGIIPDLYERLRVGGRFPWAGRAEDLDTRVVTIADDTAEVVAKWPALAARNPHFVKIILAFSEEYERRRDNPAYGGVPGEYSAKGGASPAIVPIVARLAHAAGLRLSVHIETATDFRVAVDGGADLIAHLPGSWQIGERTGFADGRLDHWLLTAEDARRAAERDVAVITTAASGIANPGAVEVHRHNLALLSAAGVRILLGSDDASGGVLGEAMTLDSLGLLGRAELLRSITMTTPRAIFPGRHVGGFRPGDEASLLVLQRNPLDDLSALLDIRLAMKEGVVLRR